MNGKKGLLEEGVWEKGASEVSGVEVEKNLGDIDNKEVNVYYNNRLSQSGVIDTEECNTSIRLTTSTAVRVYIPQKIFAPLSLISFLWSDRAQIFRSCFLNSLLLFL